MSFFFKNHSDIFFFTLSTSFLNDLERIASRTYEPSDDDVVRARLRTLGVQEYKIELTSDANSQNVLLGTSLPCQMKTIIHSILGTMSSIEYGREWTIYDVGGSRTAVSFCFLTRYCSFFFYDTIQRHAWLPYFDNVQAIIFREFQS